MDTSGIAEELEAERRELLKLIANPLKATHEPVELGSIPFLSYEETGKKLMITGIALAEGLWKNVFYPAEEIAKAAPNLKGKPLKVEHGQDPDFGDRAVGQVLDAYYDKDLRAIVFKAEVTDPEAIKLIKDGEFKTVSCSTWLDKLPINESQSIGFNFLFNELSLCRSPACEKCYIFAVEELSKRLTSQDLNKGNEDEEVVTNMPEEKSETVEVVEELKESINLSEIEPPKLYAVIEAESLSDIPENLMKKVITYYYGYPYPYYYGKYPYPHYPYYPYYPFHGCTEKPGEAKTPVKPEKKSLWAVLELATPEELKEVLASGKKVVAVYYGYYGYPYPGYPYYGYGYGYGYYPYHAYYPYYPYYGYPYCGYPYYPYYGYYYMSKEGTEVKGLAIVENEEGKQEPVEFKDFSELVELAKKKKVVIVYYPYYPHPCPYPYPYKYPVPKKEEKKSDTPCGELSDNKVEEIIDSLDLAEDYRTFMKQCMREKTDIKDVVERMKACAAEWRKKTGQAVEEVEKYPAPLASPTFTDMVPGSPQLKQPGPTLDEGVYKEQQPVPDLPTQAKEIAKEIKLSEETKPETDKKEEEVKTVTVVENLSECKECEKKEEKVETKPAEATATQETKQTETKTEAPKEEPKTETKTEEKKEEKPTETPKTEEQKQEEKKEEKQEISREELEKYVREHWPELLAKRRIF